MQGVKGLFTLTLERSNHCLSLHQIIQTKIDLEILSPEQWEKFFNYSVVIVWDFYVNPFHFSFFELFFVMASIMITMAFVISNIWD